MSGLVGFLAARPGGEDPLPAQLAAGRTGHQVSASWRLGPLSIGVLDLPPVGEPERSPDGRFTLWFVGELFTPAPNLLARLLAEGFDAVTPRLDGEFQLALWDARAERLTVALDRFAGWPLYLAQGAAGASGGVAFGGRVASLLAAPGISAEPDLEALREAVTFGGYRLGGRTLVRGVEMLPGAAVVTLEPGRAPVVRRAWRFRDLAPTGVGATVSELVPELRRRFERAVGKRLVGAERPGQTLSGGLDSRAILAVAAPRVPRFATLTYGLPGCDDARYAARAAHAAGAAWSFLPLYGEHEGVDWLERRRRFVLETDGLIDLHDLGHLESIPRQEELLDVHLSGYIGDAVAGPTFHDVTTPELVLAALPYLGGPLALPWPEALERTRELTADLGDAPAFFALFEHKLPQSTNRWATAFRPWFRVRKPFTDLELFDFCLGLPPAVRGPGRLYERSLAESYPALFARIPNQKTGLPVLASPLRHQVARARRFAQRRLGLARHRRAYTDDHAALSAPGVWPRVEATVLRPGSLAVELFGRAAVADVLARFRDQGAGAVQTIGALWSFEVYWSHRSGHHSD